VKSGGKERARAGEGRAGRRKEEHLALAFGRFKCLEQRDPAIEPSEGDILVTNL
jgi:hypothetical protein